MFMEKSGAWSRKQMAPVGGNAKWNNCLCQEIALIQEVSRVHMSTQKRNANWLMFF